ncbi:MAG TPA: hypothetical protein VD864_08130, partial [Nocardioides sp.]|nr:hypothetical protein [Nocardioides sp.]
MPERMDEEPGQDVGNDTPSLELPSLGWRRKRRRTAPTTAPTTPDAGAPEPTAAGPETAVEPAVPVVPTGPAAPAAPEPTVPVSVAVAQVEPA